MATKSGSATITKTNVFVEVPHGLGFAPDLDDITVTPKDDLGGRSYWPSDPTITSFRININVPDPESDHLFGYTITTDEDSEELVCVTPESVRRRINVTESVVSDEIVSEFITDAGETLELETGLTINPVNCTKAQAVPIRNLAAVYCGAYITGGTSSGMNFRVGDLAVNESQTNSVGNANLQFLLDEVKRFIAKLNAGDFRVVNA
jgi:hypothetical protein